MAKTKTLRLALAQINPTVGALELNAQRICETLRELESAQPDLVIFPELILTGYPPEDLLHKPGFVKASTDALRDLAKKVGDVPALVGFVDGAKGKVYDAAALLHNGKVLATYHKQCLPNYAVFDEQRYFTPGKEPLIINCGGVRLGVIICEDLWDEKPLELLAKKKVKAAVCLSASPYHRGKLQERERLFKSKARKAKMAIAYCNLVGGQDELVFDGGSLFISAQGDVLSHAPQFKESTLVVDVKFPVSSTRVGKKEVVLSVPESKRSLVKPVKQKKLSAEAEVYQALTLGVHDYVVKNGFNTVVLGLSGGIDSALTACVAVDALGPERVVGVVMPSRYSSDATQSDAQKLANNLGMRVQEISIEPLFKAYLSTLKPLLAEFSKDELWMDQAIMEQNLQARIRGMMLMALSNAFGWMVLTTGNKSEIATGYTTLYGDMAGGFAAIKDVPKTFVYKLSEYRNQLAGKALIPEMIIKRAPSAELAADQKDEDSLPAYAVLDRILEAYIEQDLVGAELKVKTRSSQAVIERVVRLVDRAEYKRRQGPPGVRITPKAFGKDRRMPITNGWKP